MEKGLREKLSIEMTHEMLLGADAVKLLEFSNGKSEFIIVDASSVLFSC
jgi:hypothetical protein